MKKILLLFMCMYAFCASAFHGTLCLTFDDRFFANWEKAIPLFARYNAHVTFFVTGKIDSEALAVMKKLQAAGHSIGLHSLSHARAVEYFEKYGAEAYTENEIMPQLEVCRKNGIKIRAFAYPNSRRNKETDIELFKNFDFLRTNCREVLPNGKKLVEADGFFNRNVGKKHLFHGFPSCDNFNPEDLKKAIKRAADENAVIVFYAHDITEKAAPYNHIALFQLEDLLKYAASLNMAICGLNEL